MELAQYLPIWDKLTDAQQKKVAEAADYMKVKKGTHIHDSSADCLGLLLIRSGQLRTYILSEDGREITLNRLFDYDVCLLSASCVMPDMQFNVMIEAEKDSEFWSIPACLFKNLMDSSVTVSNFANSLMSSHFSELMWLMEQIMWKSFDKRLAAFLLEERKAAAQIDRIDSYRSVVSEETAFCRRNWSGSTAPEISDGRFYSPAYLPANQCRGNRRCAVFSRIPYRDYQVRRSASFHLYHQTPLRTGRRWRCRSGYAQRHGQTPERHPGT